MNRILALWSLVSVLLTGFFVITFVLFNVPIDFTSIAFTAFLAVGLGISVAQSVERLISGGF